MKNFFINIMRFGLLITGMILFFSCQKQEKPAGSVVIISPSEGDTLYLNHPVEIRTSFKDAAPQKVILSLGERQVQLTDTPYIHRWTTNNMQEGNYLCKAEGILDDGKVIADSITVRLQYMTVTIGDRIWMKENLKRTVYSDGSPVKGVYIYEKDTAYAEEYGMLYTWDAVMHGEKSVNTDPSGVQGVCPDGWHVPSRAEFDELVNELGGPDIAGGKMKETGYEHWVSPNDGASNSSGFTAYGSGQRNTDGSFDRMKQNAGFWTTTENPKDPGTAVYQCLTAIHPITRQWTDPKNMGYSVRCVKDK